MIILAIVVLLFIPHAFASSENITSIVMVNTSQTGSNSTIGCHGGASSANELESLLYITIGTFVLGVIVRYYDWKDEKQLNDEPQN